MSTEPATAVSPTRYFWLQLAALGAGLGALFLAHDVAQRQRDLAAGATFSTAVVVFVVSTSLAVIGRAVYVIVTSAFSDVYRVFRTRHLVACAVLLCIVAVVVVGALIARGPFEKLFAHGGITGADIIDVATSVAALVCMIGGGVATIGAWDRMHEERNWSRAAHP
jgi:uncharacterized membrane protein YidH (DUF202 family)